MKILISFLITYVITLTLILTIHFHLSDDYRSQVKVTKSGIHGLSYLSTLYKLSVNITSLNNTNITQLKRDTLEKNILNNINTLYSIQKENKSYVNTTFNVNLEKLKQFNMTTQEYYTFIELMRLENYRIGDVSKLLFQRDRKIYFLSSLATHYMPEYLNSFLINHNIVEELQGDIYFFKEDIFAEQKKLISLSSSEISAIIEGVSEYQDTKILLTYMSIITKELNKLSQNIDTDLLFKRDTKSIQNYLTISDNILFQSSLLNTTYMKIMKDNLNSKLSKIENDIIFLNISIIIVALLLTMLFLYAYRLYKSREKQHIDLLHEQERTKDALAFKSRFLSNMSHEIRTPLNTIVGLTDVIKKTYLTQKQSDILNKINNAGEILLGVINDILDIAKIESGMLQIVPDNFELQKMITDIKDMFADEAKEENNQIKIKYENIHNFHLIGDSLRISQILINFISNSIKFTKGGDIILTIKGSKSNDVTFEVLDTGIGIKKESIETLFEEFTQADMDTTRKYGGTGLGLAISKNLVNMMGGEIKVTSEYGFGSTFSFTIPLPESKETNTKELAIQKLDDLETEVNQLQNITILIAEDNKMNQTLLGMLLEDSQLNLEYADDGEMAVDMAKEKAYDLILMDIQMPRMNGYEATKRIREIHPTVPILALSANVMQEDIEKSLESGMNCHLAKPINMEKLYIELLNFLKQ